MFKILDEVCTPKRGTKYSAYVDLFAREDITIGAGETKIVKLGVKLDLDLIDRELLGINSCKNDIVCLQIWERFLRRYYLEIALRSSLGVKGLIIANGIGIIDLDYPDEIGLIVHNPVQIREFVQNGNNYTTVVDSDDSEFVIKKGDKVAQCTLKEHKGYLMGYETEIARVGGFGSTDKKVL
jgi:dUTPase